MRDPKDIVNHMQELDSLGKDTDNIVFYVACENSTIDYLETDDGMYGKVRFCDFKQRLDCDNAEDARRLVAEMNQLTACCPSCGMAGKYKVFTDLDYVRREEYTRKFSDKMHKG